MISSEEPTAIQINALRYWLKSVAFHEILTQEDEVKLGKKIAVGDQEAVDKLVQSNLRLVVSVALKYQGNNVSLEDLIQEGNIGLMKAANKFDYEKGFKFSTYAIWWIRQGILRSLDNNSRMIRLPSYVVTKVKKLDGIYAKLRQKLKREPTKTELSIALDISQEELNEISKLQVNIISLEASLSNDPSSISLRETIEDESANPENGFVSSLADQDLIEHLLSKLKHREREVIKMRYGIGYEKELTLSEIGKRMNVTRERIRQLEMIALARLKRLYNRIGDFQDLKLI